MNLIPIPALVFLLSLLLYPPFYPYNDLELFFLCRAFRLRNRLDIYRPKYFVNLTQYEDGEFLICQFPALLWLLFLSILKNFSPNTLKIFGLSYLVQVSL